LRDPERMNVWKISDFDLSFQDHELPTRTVLSGGGKWYAAPEVSSMDLRDDSFGNSIDIWSLGCIVYELHTGTRAFTSAQEYWLFMMQNKELPRSLKASERKVPESRTLSHMESTIPKILWEVGNDLCRTSNDIPGDEATFLNQVIPSLLKMPPKDRPSAKEVERLFSASLIRSKFERETVCPLFAIVADVNVGFFKAGICRSHVRYDRFK
jgi:serine/threonine protein kinase